jgi:hypothetical protein
MFDFEFNFHNLKKEKINVDWIACYKIVSIRNGIFQFHISVISNSVLPFISYHLLLNDTLKNEK